MKKILFLLLLTIYGLQAQTYQNPTYGTLTLKTSPTVNSHPYLTTTESNGVQSKVVSVMNQNANTGLLLGGVISVNADPTKWNLAFGEGYVADPLNGTVAKVAWGTQSALTTPYLTTSTATYVLIANAGSGIGSVVMQNTPPTQQQYRTHVYLGKLAHTTKTTILFAVTEPSRMFDAVGQIMDLNSALKSMNVEGNTLSANGANLNLNISSGKIYRAGANYASDRNNPSLTTLSSGTAITFRNKFRDGSGGWNAVNTSTVDADHYDDGTGILATVPNNKYTVRVAWRFGGTGTVHLDYGQAVYNTLAEAKSSIPTATVVKDPDNVKDAVIIGWIIVKKGTTALNNTAENEFLRGGMFGESALSAGGTTTMQGAYNNSVSPQIITSTTAGAVAIKRGSAADTDNVLVVQNGAGSDTFSVNGNGNITAGTYNNYVPAALDNTGKIISAQTNNQDGNLGQISNKNLTDYTTFTSGKMVSWVDGNLNDNPNTKSTNFIPVTAGLKYRYISSGFLGFIGIAFYDKNQVFISGSYLSETDSLITIPANTYFIRTSYPNSTAQNRDYFYQSYKFSSYGDSITAQNMWQPLLSQYLGLTSTVVGYGGASLVGTSSGALNQDTRLNTIPLDSDIITVLVGTNDWAIGYPLGSETSTDVNEFYGALNSTFKKLKIRYPNALIVALETTYGMYPGYFTNPIGIFNNLGLATSDYGNAIENAAKNNKIRFIRTDNLWNDKNISNFVTFDGAYLHPNAEGGKLIASKISLDLVQDILLMKQNVLNEKLKTSIVNDSGTPNVLSKFDYFGNLTNSNISDNGSLITTATDVTVGGILNSNSYHKITGSSPYTSYFMTAISEWKVGLTDSGSGFYNFLADDIKVASISGSGMLKTKAINIENDPTTSAGSYDILTRNSSTGVVEKVSSTSIATSGTFTPALTNVLNVASATLTNAYYIKVGNIVTVTVGLSVTATAANTNTVLKIDLPIARVSSGTNNIGMAALADNSTHIVGNVQTSGDTATASLYYYPTTTNAHVTSVTFQYYLN